MSGGSGGSGSERVDVQDEGMERREGTDSERGAGG